MGIHWSSFRGPNTTDNLSYFPLMRRSSASPQSHAGPNKLSKSTGGIHSTRHSALIPPPKSPFTTSATTPASPSSPSSPSSHLHHHHHRPLSPPQPQPTRRPAVVPRSKLQTKVRDFAFINTDDRHIGLGPTAPKASQFPRLNKKLGGSKRARPTVSPISGLIEAVPLGDDDGIESSDYPEEDEEEDERPRIQFGPRFGAFFDSDSDDDSDDDDSRPGAGAKKGGAVSGVRGGAGGRPGRRLGA